MDLQLEGRACLVTGASQGIGKGTARVMAAEGCRVALLARRTELLQALADEIAGTGWARPAIIDEDVTADGAPARIRERVADALGGLEILVNCAGGSRPIPWDAPDDAWDEGMTLNFEALRKLTHAFIPGMRERKWGRIVNITGTSEPDAVNIASSAKAAVHAWAKGLSRVLAKDGITVNCLPPGRIKSEQILERLHADPVERQAFVDANIPVGYLGEPEDMAYLIAFLASPLARYITGEVIHVDGGMRRFAH
ncbi:MAG: SDR family NAD(P)-dependent oxidoreductase [Rhodospirillales bacterium]